MSQDKDLEELNRYLKTQGRAFHFPSITALWLAACKYKDDKSVIIQQANKIFEENKQLCHKLEESDKIVSKLKECVEFYANVHEGNLEPSLNKDYCKEKGYDFIDNKEIAFSHDVARQCLKEVDND